MSDQFKIKWWNNHPKEAVKYFNTVQGTVKLCIEFNSKTCTDTQYTPYNTLAQTQSANLKKQNAVF